MDNLKKYVIEDKSSIKEALVNLNKLKYNPILFVVDKDQKLLGSVTDGDIRRGLLRDLSLDSNIKEIIQPNPKYVTKSSNDILKLIDYRNNGIKVLPVLLNKKIIDVIDFSKNISSLPLDVIVMAGGKGSRLMPLTKSKPKPLIKLGDKPIIEHNIDRLIYYGIDKFWITVNYLKEQIINYLNDGSKKGIDINYISENKPLGTIGAVSKLKNNKNKYVLLTNSDILTNLNYESFFLDFINKKADISVITIPYQVNIPYGVIETSNKHVVSIKEKPQYTYYSNGGIYLIKKELLSFVPKNKFYNATDFIEDMLKKNKKIISYPTNSYWLDIGKHEDYEKAKNDINQLKL